MRSLVVSCSHSGCMCGCRYACAGGIESTPSPSSHVKVWPGKIQCARSIPKSIFMDQWFSDLMPGPLVDGLARKSPTQSRLLDWVSQSSGLRTLDQQRYRLLSKESGRRQSMDLVSYLRKTLHSDGRCLWGSHWMPDIRLSLSRQEYIHARSAEDLRGTDWRSPISHCRVFVGVSCRRSQDVARPLLYV